MILVIDGWRTSCEIALHWMSQCLNDDELTLVQVIACCCQATNPCLNQCWPRSMSPYGITRPQGIKLGFYNMVIHTCMFITMASTVKCRYNMVLIFHTPQHWLMQNINQTLDSQASYGASVVRILDKIDHIMMAPRCIWYRSGLELTNYSLYLALKAQGSYKVSCLLILADCGLVKSYGIKYLGQHWFRYWLVTLQVTSH